MTAGSIWGLSSITITSGTKHVGTAMTNLTQSEAELQPIRPKFLDLVENGYASEQNPHKVGIFIRKGYRSGRMNPGAYLVFADGKGDFWEIGNRPGHKMTIVGNLGDTRELEGLENIVKQLPAFQKLTDEQEERLLGKLMKQRLSTLRTELSKKEKQS